MKPNELAKSGTFNLLQALILSNNNEAKEIELNTNKLTHTLKIVSEQNKQIETLKSKLSIQSERIADQDKTIKFNENLLLKAEKTEQKSVAKDRELQIVKTKVTELQQELSGLSNAKKLNKLVKSQKEKAVDRNKRIEALEKEVKAARKEIKEEKYVANLLIDKAKKLKRQLEHNTGSGLYHKGEHHLIIWPEKTKIQRSDGSIFEGRSLLYLHQSGCGKLINYDIESNEVLFCKPPKNGLRPSEEVKDFAKNWLYTVNAMQDGIVSNSDMIAVNYNVDP